MSTKIFQAILTMYHTTTGQRRKQEALATLASLSRTQIGEIWAQEVRVWRPHTGRDDFGVDASDRTIELARRGRRRARAEIVARWCEWAYSTL